ncbi:LysR family transcriptional regulator [Thalassotalea euphylliae]|uniref:LysR family transcriptional regulator n=1 Tax=Thalassotalea euphylliae TaxID=1655234 RepID=A0A3E0UBW0_9GAMM|nr:LysR family transcriptional regulator [Thalassotalea euphylliae]REL34330.1 LysR family transcriptional regulator [Thalassotalea euphylliae]
MKLSYLESFYLVTKLGSITKAADQLNVSKSVVSRYIKQLESQCAAQLLLRTTRSITPTEAGQALYIKCQAIFSLTQEAEQDIRDITQQNHGRLRFSCTVSLGEVLAEQVLPVFCQSMPEVKLKLNLSNDKADIVNGEQDIALRADDSLDDNLVAKYLGRLKDVIVASPVLVTSLVRSHGELTQPNQLAEMPCLINSHQQHFNQWQFSHSEKPEVSVDVSGDRAGAIASNSYFAMRQLALNHMGIARMPYYLVADDIKAGALVLLLADYSISTHSLYIVHARHNRLPNKLRVFKQLLVDWRAAHPELFE